MIDFSLIDMGDSVKLKDNDSWFTVVETYGDGTIVVIPPNGRFRFILRNQDEVVDWKKKDF